MSENQLVTRLISLERCLRAGNIILMAAAISILLIVMRESAQGAAKTFLPKSVTADEFKNIRVSPAPTPYSHYQEIFAAKNIFAPARFSAGEIKDSAAISRPRLTLAGIVIVGDRPLALIRDPENNLDFYCQGGEDISGYHVKEVTPKKVILELDGQEIELQL